MMTINTASILRELWSGWLLRWGILKRGLYSLSFWTAALVLASWLRAAGFGYVVVTCFALWAAFSLLALYLQTRLLLDLVSFCFTKRLRFYPRLMAFGRAQTEVDRRRIAQALLPFVPRTVPASANARTLMLRRFFEPIAAIAVETSPLAPLANCASTMLAQIPESTRAEDAIKAVKAEAAAERAAYALYVGVPFAA